MNNTTKSIIERYLNSSNIPYAILLDGKWGTGKTWFIKNKFEDHFKGKKIVYASANGISSLEDISSQIIYRSFFKNNNLGWKVAKLALKSLNKLSDDFLKNTKDLVTLSKDEVLIIDDIERMNSSISMEDFLGYISTNFTEENSIKVILIADEAELLGKLEKLGKEKDEYLRRKEKTIWQTVKYNLEIESVYDDIIKLFKNTTKFLRKKKDYFIPLFKQHKVVNLRWILYYFQILNDIVEEEKGFFDDDKRELILSTILILCLEYKKGRLTSRSEQEIAKYIKDFDTPFPSKDIEKFKDEYTINWNSYGFWNSYYFFESLYNIVCYGTLEINEIKQEVENYEQKQIHPQNILLIKLQNFDIEDDNDYSNKWKQVMKHIDKDEYSNEKLIEISLMYVEASNQGLEIPICKEKLYDKLKTHIREENKNVETSSVNYKYTDTPEEHKELLKIYGDTMKKKESNDLKSQALNILTIEPLDLSSYDIYIFLEHVDTNDILKFSRIICSCIKNIKHLISVFDYGRYGTELSEKKEQNLNLLIEQLLKNTEDTNIAKHLVKPLVTDIKKYINGFKN